MKFAYFLAIAVGAQDGGDGGTPHDPEAMAFCQGKFKGILYPGYKITNRNLDLQIILRKTRWFLSRCKRLWFLLLLLE